MVKLDKRSIVGLLPRKAKMPRVKTYLLLALQSRLVSMTYTTTVSCKVKRQHLLTCRVADTTLQVSKCCLLVLHDTVAVHMSPLQNQKEVSPHSTSKQLFAFRLCTADVHNRKSNGPKTDFRAGWM